MSFSTRKIKKSDLSELVALYKKSATIKEGLARTPQEITKEYIGEIIDKATKDGLGLVITDENKKITACLISYKLEPKAFKHTLGNMSLAVDPSYFGQGLGKKIFRDFVDEVRQNRPDIARVELNVRESNKLGIKIYQSVGFVIEGVQKNRILDAEGKLSDDMIMGWMNSGFR